MRLVYSTLMIVAFALPQNASAVSINEIQPNPVGADPSLVELELLGIPGMFFDGFLLSIESDSTSSTGLVDRLSSVSGTFDVNGLLTVMISDLENPSFTLVLLDSFSGAVGTDIDTDDDGIADDLSTFGNVLDAIGSPDNVGDEAFLYGAQLGGADFSYTGDEPQLIFRDALTLAWYAINDPAGTNAFDIFGSPIAFSEFNMDPSIATFGAINPNRVVPVPAALWLFFSALGALGWRRSVA